jgi:hypothetical protein
VTAAKGKNGDDGISGIVAELKHLRSELRDAAESFALRREGEIETIVAMLAALPRRRARGAGEEWMRHLRGLKLKPAKGRLRDLKEIARTVDLFLDDLAALQQGPVKRKRSGRDAPPAELR